MYVVMSCGVLSHLAVVICSCGCGCSYAGSCTWTQVRSSLSFAPLRIQGPQTNSFFCSEGSVVVNFTMYLRGVIDPVTATAPLRQEIESGKLGDFSVSKNSFAVTITIVAYIKNQTECFKYTKATITRERERKKRNISVHCYEPHGKQKRLLCDHCR